jgi:hypothetical protein
MADDDKTIVPNSLDSIGDNIAASRLPPIDVVVPMPPVTPPTGDASDSD